MTMEVDEDGNHLASVPDLPGCVAGAATREETFAELSACMDAVLSVIREDDPQYYSDLLALQAWSTPDPPWATDATADAASWAA
ncbi:MAG: type II toxin-antitoxin system HicB family antitoxin [Myxococcota bacterium]